MTIKARKYSNVNFTSSSIFSMFMSDLETLGMVTEQVRQDYGSGTAYALMEDGEGLTIVTDRAVVLTKGKVACLEAIGSNETLQRFEKLLDRYASFTRRVLIEETEHYAYHEELNPKFWSSTDHIDSDVRDTLMENAKEFEEFLSLEGLKVQDVILTGSNANYNWTDYSDLDVHLVIDGEAERKKFGKALDELLDTKRKLWNLEHDVKVKGQDVEMYAQDGMEGHVSTGVYSLKNDEWLIEPPSERTPEIDDAAVNRKVESFKKEIDNILSSKTNRAGRIEALFDKIVKARRAGLAKGGEFDESNLAFKVLRNDGSLERLDQALAVAIDAGLSLEEEELALFRS